MTIGVSRMRNKDLDKYVIPVFVRQETAEWAFFPAISSLQLDM